MAEKLKILFLDDRSKRIHAALKKYAEHDLTIVTTVKECIEKISNKEWDLISLDHDLNYEVFVDSNRPDCGMEVVRFMVKNRKFLFQKSRHADIIIHTSNRAAGFAMKDVLQKAGIIGVSYERFEYE